jgi:hypothetical protein
VRVHGCCDPAAPSPVPWCPGRAKRV